VAGVGAVVGAAVGAAAGKGIAKLEETQVHKELFDYEVSKSNTEMAETSS